MGRGLSDLQKNILTLAYEAHEPGKDQAIKAYEDGLKNNRPFNFDPLARMSGSGFDSSPAWHDGFRHWHRVTTSEIYHFFFGCPWNEYRWAGNPMFVDPPPSNSVRVVVSKALKRLADRGLIGKLDDSRGWFLSPDGVKVAEKLMAN